MTGLAELRDPAVRTWEEAYASFRWESPETYSIAADCLRAPAQDVAILAVEGEGMTPVSFGELGDLAARLARRLVDQYDVARGDRVAVKLPQSIEMAVAVLAGLRLGAVVVPISNVLGDDAVLHRLTDSGATVLVCAGDDRERRLADDAGTAVLLVHGPSDRAWLDGGLAGHEPLRDLPVLGPDDPAFILYTSGTTGSSKGVLHAQRVLLGHHALDLAWDHVRPGDVAYSPVDWAWAGGLMLGLLVPLAYGMTVVAYRDTRFDPHRTVAIMRAAGVTVGLFPPTALRMLKSSGALTSGSMRELRLRSLVTGAEAVEPEIFSWARDDLGLGVNNAFGQTEANAVIGHSQVLGALEDRCLGRPYPGHEVAVLDAEQRPVPPGVVGEIAVRASDPVCMLRYWNAPEATAAKFRNGWLLTGDCAHVDDRGNLHFHGRDDDLIKSGGYRLGPSEIEAALLRDAAVEQAAVVGLPDAERGTVITAYVVLAAGSDASPELARRLQQEVRERVGAHAYPRRVEFVDRLERTSTGKIDRRALRTRAQEAGTA